MVLLVQDNLQGLAHFCEHLLFMGTEKYPKENDYNQYLAEHSGFSNAFTGVENTNYYFEVGHEYLEGALDRFAQFFIAPLFSASCTERELKAVDSGKFAYDRRPTYIDASSRTQEKPAAGQLAYVSTRKVVEQPQPSILSLRYG